MAAWNDWIPQDFIDTLDASVEGFREQSERDRWGLAWMAWQGSQKRRQHRTVPGALSFSAQELDNLFGRGGFKRLLLSVEFFSRSPGWSKAAGTTRAYWFSAQVQTAQLEYGQSAVSSPVNLLTHSGGSIKVLRTLPQAISSIDTNGRTTSTDLWASAKSMNKVPVDIAMLDALRRWLNAQLDDPGRVEGSLRHFIERLLDTTSKIIRLSNTTLTPNGQLPQVYAIAPTGRLYARGLSLQNTPGVIKEAALHGMWEYDFANCHFAVVAQMGKKAGVTCDSIEYYLANKAQVRQHLADAALIPPELAKRCLLALLYGATPSGRERDAIPGSIGVEAARRLYAQDFFKLLASEITRARKAILDQWPRTANGSLANACGKAIRGSATAPAKLAHLVQGVEARALNTVVNAHASELVLLQHDGFVATRRLPLDQLEEAVASAVGYRLQLVEQRLQLHDDPQALLNRTKIDMGLEAAPDLGFDSVSAD